MSYTESLTPDSPFP